MTFGTTPHDNHTVFIAMNTFGTTPHDNHTVFIVMNKH